MQALLDGVGGQLAECDSPDALDGLVAQAALGADDVLGIVGGDGTVSAVLGAFGRGGRPLPRLALLRGGTMNTVARGLGVPGRDPPELLQTLIGELAAGPLACTSRSTVLVDGREGFLFGMGVMASFLDVYNALPRKGLLGAAQLLGRASLGALTGRGAAEPVIRPLTARLTLDGRALPEATYQMLAAASVDQVGLGFAPFHRAPECQGRLHMFAFKGSIQQLVWRLPALHRGTPLVPEQGVDELAEQITIDGAASGPAASAPEPLRYSLDGEVYTALAPLQVSASAPRRIWRPRR
jgi:diacylglycerol kinase (ATP)